MGLLVLGIGALQVMLDRGQQDDWFGSSFITALAIIAAVALVVWEWRHPEPSTSGSSRASTSPAPTR